MGTALTAERLGASIVRPRPTINRNIVFLHRPAALSPVAAHFMAMATSPTEPAV